MQRFALADLDDWSTLAAQTSDYPRRSASRKIDAGSVHITLLNLPFYLVGQLTRLVAKLPA